MIAPHFFSPSQRRGFTLLELLVVIAIIGLLASITFLSFGRARQKARDTRRLSDIRQLQNVLELYAADHETEYPNEYPPSGSLPCDADVGMPGDCRWAEYPDWIPALVPAYAAALPLDPRGFAQFTTYKYQRDPEYGYVLSFRPEADQAENQCGFVYHDATISTRCARRP